MNHRPMFGFMENSALIIVLPSQGKQPPWRTCASHPQSSRGAWVTLASTALSACPVANSSTAPLHEHSHMPLNLEVRDWCCWSKLGPWFELMLANRAEKQDSIGPLKLLPRPASYSISFTFTYPLTTRVFGAPQMTSQPVSSVLLCSPLPSGTW